MSEPKNPVFLTTQLRHALFYAIIVAGAGASLPFIPVWFKSKGMGAGEISVILALPHLLRAVTGPLIGVWADRFKIYRTPMVILGVCGAVTYAFIWPAAGLPPALRFWAFLLFWTLGFSFTSFVSPLIDAMNIQLARREGFNYGIPRAAGSAAFIIANVMVGKSLMSMSSDTIIIWVIAAMASSAVAAQFILEPHIRIDHEIEQTVATQSTLQRVKILIQAPGFLVLMLAVGLIQASHAFYYAYSTLIWTGRGISAEACGYLWALAVVAEIIFMSLGAGFRHRIGPWWLLISGGVVAALRWGIMMTAPPLWVLWPLQIGHAFSFAATYMAGLELVHRLTPKGHEGFGQTVHAAYANGVLMGLFTLLSGVVYLAFGTQGYGAMALMAGLGLLMAFRLLALSKAANL
jgi:PPP family 3-phenylpropionic acid transporter